MIPDIQIEVFSQWLPSKSTIGDRSIMDICVLWFCVAKRRNDQAEEKKKNPAFNKKQRPLDRA